MKKTCLVLALTGAMGLASTQTMAGFVADFLDESAAMSNVTQAGVVEASSLNVVTGGGFVYRTPRKDFVPLSRGRTDAQGRVRGNRSIFGSVFHSLP